MTATRTRLTASFAALAALVLTLAGAITLDSDRAGGRDGRPGSDRHLAKIASTLGVHAAPTGRNRRSRRTGPTVSE